MTETVTNFAARLGVTATAERAHSNPNSDAFNAPGTRHWLVTLRSPQGTLSVPFSQGSAHAAPPTLEDVLDCLASDSSGFENTADRFDWLREYGYDAEDESAARTYNAVVEQTHALATFLGEDEYENLLWKTERL